MVAHRKLRTLPNTDKAAYAAFIVQQHHAASGFAKRHNGTHRHARAALVAGCYAKAALTIRADSNCTLFSVLNLVSVHGARCFATSAP